MHDLNIAYFNARGLSIPKFSYALTLLQHYHIVFISETWFLHHADHASHPNCIAYSKPTEPRPQHGHARNGIMCLAQPTIHPHLQSVTTTPFTINITLFSKTISACYFPPSLSPAVITQLLTTKPVDILLGDINTRYGARFQDRTTGPKERMTVFQQVASLYHLQHLLPDPSTPTKTRVDHAFAKPSTSCKLVFYPIDFGQPGVSTDHPLLSLSTTLPTLPHNQPILPGLTRFYLKDLDSAVIVASLRDNYEATANLLSSLLEKLKKSLPTLSVTDRQEHIDYLDDLLVHNVSSSAATVLGSYDASAIRSTPDRLAKSLSLCTDASTAIRLFKRQKRSTSTPCQIQSRSENLSAVEDVEKHFTTIFSQPTPSLHPNTLHNSPFHGVGSRDIAKMFDKAATQLMISDYPSARSCGSDALHPRLLRALLDSSFPSHLSQLFQLCALTGLTPARWNSSVIFPIPKAPNSKEIPDFRPIALTQMFRRLFERGLLKHLSDLLPFKNLSPTQAGFRSGFSTLSHALASHATAQHHPQLHQIFLDLKSAYDTVPVPLLLRKLEDRRAPPESLSLIQSLFTNCSVSVVVNGLLTPPIPTERGLFQGSLLSPLLFDVFIDDLSTLLSPFPIPDSPFPNHLLYADDIKLQHSDARKIQDMLDVCSSWSQQNGMTFNIKKCGSLSGDVTTLHLNGATIPSVDSYKYLGFPHARAGINWIGHMTAMTAKASATLSAIKDASYAWRPGIRLAIYRSFIRPQLEYGAPLVHHVAMRHRSAAQSLLSAATACHQRAASWICGSRYHNTSFSIIGLPPLPHRFLTLACMFTTHITNLHPLNPCRHAWNLYRNTMWRPSLLLPFIFSAKPRNLLPPVPADTPLSHALQSQIFLSNIRSLSNLGLMASLILPCARSSRSLTVTRPLRGSAGPDSLLQIPDEEIQHMALKWRLNTTALRCICPSCSKPFHRSHIHSCHLLDHHPDFVPKTSPSYIADLALLPPSAKPSYTILDHLLNHRKYLQFHSLLTYLTSTLLAIEPPS